MTGFQILREILGQAWAIHESQLQAFQALIPGIRNGQTVHFGDLAHFNASKNVDKDENPENKFLHFVSAMGQKPRADGHASFVGVIEFRGTVMKQDYCGSIGTQTLGHWIRQLDQDPNVEGIVLSLDSPGGSVAGTEALAKIIAGTQKPIVAWVDGMAASAAYWLASQTDHIMFNDDTDLLGSIGTMFAMLDLVPMYEAEGAVYYELYASQSTEKNGAFRQMEQGKNDAMIARLSEYQSVFEAAVISGRGDKLQKEKTLKGQDYLGKQALEYGLADSRGSLQDAVNLVADLAASQKNKNQKSNMGLFGMITPAAIKALVGQAASDVSEEALDAANAAIEAENIIGFELVRRDDILSLQNNAADMKAANADLTRQLADMTQRAEAAEAKAKELGEKAGSSPAAVVSTAASEAQKETNPDNPFLTSWDKEAQEFYSKSNQA